MTFSFFSVFFAFLVVQARQSGDDLHLGSEGLACSLHMETEESKVRENLGGRGLAIVYELKKLDKIQLFRGEIAASVAKAYLSVKLRQRIKSSPTRPEILGKIRTVSCFNLFELVSIEN